MPKPDEFSFGRPQEAMLCSADALPATATFNGFELASFVNALAHDWVDSGHAFTAEIVREANRIAMNGIYASAGEYRTVYRAAGNLVPPNWKEVPNLVAAMCDYVNVLSGDALHAAAYILWRINWIHPFYDGNGRIARELSYLALLAGHQATEFPGNPSIPELIRRREDRYIECLQEADRTWTSTEEVNLVKLESFLAELLVDQFESGI